MFSYHLSIYAHAKICLEFCLGIIIMLLKKIRKNKSYCTDMPGFASKSYILVLKFHLISFCLFLQLLNK